MIAANLIIAVLPALLLLWLFQYWDRKRPEPPGKVRNVVLLGMALCIPVGAIEVGAGALLGNLMRVQGGVVNAYAVAAFTEEVGKALVILLYLWNKPHFDEVVDGILYTAAASLGFALLENLLSCSGDPALGLVRAFTAVPLHAIASGILGYFMGRARFSPNHKARWITAGLGVAILIHGTYDWSIFSGGMFGFGRPSPLLGLAVVIPLLVTSGVGLLIVLRKAHALDDALHGPPH